METLSEVAADVAAALGLHMYQLAPDWYSGGVDMPMLKLDGSNLIDPYWRCACEDWLDCNGYVFTSDGCIYKNQALIIDQQYWPLAEAPARLVSAVWRRMKEKP